jgi:predicted  nucleic acid-binding Zn-ribbon protein
MLYYEHRDKTGVGAVLRGEINLLGDVSAGFRGDVGMDAFEVRACLNGRGGRLRRLICKAGTAQWAREWVEAINSREHLSTQKAVPNKQKPSILASVADSVRNSRCHEHASSTLVRSVKAQDTASPEQPAGVRFVAEEDPTPDCSASNSLTAVYSSNVGTAGTATPWFCSQCGKKMLQHYGFCPRCGTRRFDVSEPQEQVLRDEAAVSCGDAMFPVESDRQAETDSDSDSDSGSNSQDEHLRVDPKSTKGRKTDIKHNVHLAKVGKYLFNFTFTNNIGV